MRFEGTEHYRKEIEEMMGVVYEGDPTPQEEDIACYCANAVRTLCARIDDLERRWEAANERCRDAMPPRDER